MSDMNKKSKKKGKLRAALTGKKFRHGWYATVLTILFIAVIIVVNVIASAVEDKWALRIDGSANQITKFSDSTYEVLDSLDAPINIYLLYRAQTRDELRVNMEEIVAKYRARNGNINLDFIDPVSEPQRITNLIGGTETLSEGSVIVTNADGSRVKSIRRTDLYNYSYDQNTYQTYATSFVGESKLTSAILYASSTDTPKVYFLTGHNEQASSSCSVLTKYLRDENYEVADLTLGTGTKLEPGDTVVILAATSDLTEDEYDEMKAWLDAGGRMMYASSPEISFEKMPKWVELFDLYGAGFSQGVVVEDVNSTSRWISNPIVVLPTLDTESTITSTLASVGRVMMPMSGAVRQSDMPKSGYQYTKLLTSGAGSFIKPIDSETDVTVRDEGAEGGPFAMAMSILRQADMNDPTKDTRIVLINGLYTLLDSQYLNASTNLDFSMNAIGWLVNRNVSVYVRSKALANQTLAIPDIGTLYTLAAIVVIVIPVIVLIAGVVVWIRRRRL